MCLQLKEQLQLTTPIWHLDQLREKIKIMLLKFIDKLILQLYLWEWWEVATDSKLWWAQMRREIQLHKWACPHSTHTLHQLGVSWDLLPKWWSVSKDQEWPLSLQITLSIAQDKTTLSCFSKPNLHLTIALIELLSLRWVELVKLMNTEVKSTKPRTPRESPVLCNWLPLPRSEELRLLFCKADHLPKL